VTIEVAGAMLAQEFLTVRPSVTTWSRLEPHPATADIAPGLAAETADPLWLLHRQWAFGELDGDDAGTPIDVRLRGDHAALGRYHPGPFGASPRTVALDYAHLDTPLEVAVEREPVRASHPRLAAAAGQHFLRLLADEGGAAMGHRFVKAFPVRITPPADEAGDRVGADWAAVLAGRALDGSALADAVRPLVAADGSVTGVPAAVSIPAGQRARVRRALARFLSAYDSMITEPGAGERSAWQPQRQEYAFALSAQSAAGRVVLRADEYSDGRLDWWAFRASIAPDIGEPATPLPSKPLEEPAMLPTPVRYPGMPADRFWEFEDGRVNLGALDAGPTDLGRLLLVEYGLVYGTDWWLVPVELPVGSLFTVTDLRVRDTFGTETRVGPSRNDSGSAWEMFELGQTGRGAARLADLFFLPPTLARRLEGDPIERVSLLRDEMANLAWGVEHQVPGVSGEPAQRSLEAAALAVHQEVPQLAPEVRRIYRLMSPVPINWIPFEPVATTGPTDPAYDLEFERRVLLRTVLLPPATEGAAPQAATEESHPRGTLLRSDLSLPVETEPPLRIAEEEIPRDGAVVTRSFQYARWFGGRSYLWLGRAKRTGRGEGSSGLRYDSADLVT
jgi:hypothetical protein